MKSYNQSCGVAQALDVVGGRWTLLLVRDLLLGPRRFTDLQHAHPGLTPKLLTDRLRELEAAGVVARETLPPPAASRVYRLTDRGTALEPAIQALGQWGEASEGDGPGPQARADLRWSLLSLKRRFLGGRQAGAVAVHAPPRAFQVAWAVGGPVVVREGSGGAAAVTLTGAPEALSAALFGGRSLRVLEQSGQLSVSGERSALSAFVVAFGLRH